jgi:hypothetical protein
VAPGPSPFPLWPDEPAEERRRITGDSEEEERDKGKGHERIGTRAGLVIQMREVKS